MELNPFHAQASFAGYVALSGIWFLLAAFYAWLDHTRPAPSIFRASVGFFLIGSLWVIWLKGFSIRIEGESLIYRNGLYQTGDLGSIKYVSNVWAVWPLLPYVRIPRVRVDFTEGSVIEINVKPFARSDLAEFRKILGK